MNLTYVGTPYTNAPGGIDRAFEQAARIAGKLALTGLAIFCPIAHGHALARAAGLDPKNPAVFAALNRKMLDVCSTLVVVRMDGWHESEGLREEIAFFERMHKPIFDLDPDNMRMTRRQTFCARAPHPAGCQTPPADDGAAPSARAPLS